MQSDYEPEAALDDDDAVVVDLRAPTITVVRQTFFIASKKTKKTLCTYTMLCDEIFLYFNLNEMTPLNTVKFKVDDFVEY